MSGNSEFELVTESGWRRGLSNLVNNEFGKWWKTSRWWKQSLVWMSIMGLILVGMLFGKEPASIGEAFMVYSIFAGVFPAVAVIITMQGALVGEKKSGTAAWVLSKPVTRTAFILSKLIANSLSILVTTVLLPGLVAFVILSIRMSSVINPVQFLIALGVIFLNLMFYLSLALMLGVFFNSRGPVVGIPLGLLFAQQYLIAFLPFLRYFLPWPLIVPLNETSNSMVANLLLGDPVSSWLPVGVIALECVLFIVLGIWRFTKEEF